MLDRVLERTFGSRFAAELPELKSSGSIQKTIPPMQTIAATEARINTSRQSLLCLLWERATQGLQCVGKNRRGVPFGLTHSLTSEAQRPNSCPNGVPNGRCIRKIISPFLGACSIGYPKPIAAKPRLVKCDAISCRSKPTADRLTPSTRPQFCPSGLNPSGGAPIEKSRRIASYSFRRQSPLDRRRPQRPANRMARRVFASMSRG